MDDQMEVKIDPNINMRGKAFGIYIKDGVVFIPTKLAEELDKFSIGKNLRSVVAFLSAFPSTIAGYLNLTKTETLAAVYQLLEMLNEQGLGVLSSEKNIRGRGALHPELLEKDKSDDNP